jgi:hypothetical protein
MLNVEREELVVPCLQDIFKKNKLSNQFVDKGWKLMN